MTPRRALAGLWAILPLALILLTMVALPPPDRVPTGWDGGLPSEFMTGPALASLLVTVTVLAAVVAGGSSVLVRIVPASWARWVLALAAVAGWGAWLLYLVTVWRVAAVGADQVREGWWLLAVAGALLAGGIGYAVHGRRRPTAAQLDASVPERARVRAVRGRAVQPVEPWATDVSSRTLRVIAWAAALLFGSVLVAVLLAGESWLLAAVVAVVGVGTWGLALAWSAVRYLVGPDGLQVRSRALPLRVLQVPAEEIAGVEVQVLDPMRWGGVGLRPLPDQTSYIVDEGGPGLVVHQRDGRRLALQVTEGDAVARAGARSLLRAAGQRLGETSSGA